MRAGYLHFANEVFQLLKIACCLERSKEVWSDGLLRAEDGEVLGKRQDFAHEL